MDLIVVRTAWVIFDDAEMIFIIIVVAVRMFGGDGLELFGISFTVLVVAAAVLLLCDVGGGRKITTLVATECSFGTDVVVGIARRSFELSNVDLWFGDGNLGKR